jgi:hypothetical protein
MGIYRHRLLPEHKKNELMIRMHPKMAYKLAKQGVPHVAVSAFEHQQIAQLNDDEATEDLLRADEAIEGEMVDIIEEREGPVADAPELLALRKRLEAEVWFA